MLSTDTANPSTVLDSLIVGAGISGLSLARALDSSPGKILVAESKSGVGGRIVTASEGGFLWEEGPNSFLPTPALMKLVVDVGLKDELVLADRRLPRYVYWNGQLMPVPMSPPAMVTSKLLSFKGKLRALFGALGFVPPAMAFDLNGSSGEETVAQFFGRHLGSEVVERLVAPFVSGTFAGDPDKLSAAGAFGRVVRMAEIGGGLLAGAILSRKQNQKPQEPLDPRIPKTQRGELGSFREGLEVLPKAIAAELGDALKLEWHLISLRSTERQTYLAEFSTPSGPTRIESRTVVMATPSYVSADLLKPLNSELSEELRGFPYPSVACVVLAYPTEAFSGDLNGFGNLIPRGQGIRTLGTIWSSSLFPGRTPKGWHLLINFIGGATDPEIANLNSEQIVDIVHGDILTTLLRQDVKPKVLAVHLWKRAIPQYNLGHLQRLENIERALVNSPGLYLCSNFSDSVALGECVRRAGEVAATVRQYLERG